MIKFIRKYSNSTISKVLLGLLALTFVFLWGIGDVIGRFTNKNYIIKIGSEKVDAEKFNTQFSINNALIQKSNIKDMSLKKQLIIEKTIQDLITKSLLNIFEKNNHLLFNSNVISYSLAKDERFLDNKNQFDINKLKSLINTQNNSEEAFIENYGESLKLMLLNVLFNGYKVSDFYAAKLIESQYERRYVQLKEFKPESFTFTEKISERELEKFYEKHADLFYVQELRTVQYIYIDKTKVNIKPTEEQLKKEFDKRVKSGELFKEEYETVKSDISIDVEEDLNYTYLENIMKEIIQSLKSGEKLENIAEKYDCVEFKTKTFSKDNTDQNGKIVIKDQFKEVLLSNVFEINKVNSPSDFVDTDDGGELLFVITNIQKPYTKSFDEVKQMVEKMYIEDQKVKLARSAAEDCMNAVNDGKSDFVGTSYSYVRSDINSNLKEINKDGLMKIFRLKDGKSDVEKVGDNYVVIKLLHSDKPGKQAVYEKSDKFKKIINKQIITDLVSQFLVYLQTKNKLDVNTQALKFN